MGKKGFNTTNLHSDRRDNPEHGVLHKPVHPSVAYGYEDARHLAEVFQGKRAGYNYGRQLNPTVTALQNRITQMEQGIASVAFATGMAAISSALLALLKEGDHIISSAFLFGNTNSFFGTLKRLGIEVTFVDATKACFVESAIQENTKLVFVETIANPVTQVADLTSIQPIISSCWGIQASYQIHEGRFAASRRPHHRHKFSSCNLEINSIQCFNGLNTQNVMLR